MNETCPWDTSSLIDSKFCEEVLCSWVAQPSNTWSNIGFLVAGFLIIRLSKSSGASYLRVLGIISFVIGIGSTMYHVTGTTVGVIFDYSGMLLSASYGTSVAIRRWRHWKMNHIHLLFASVFSFWILMIVFFQGHARIIYSIASMVCCFIEPILYIRDRPRTRYKYFGLMWLAFLIGFGAWYLDVQKIFCDPTNHVFSMHALWHLAMAVSLYFSAKFYAQFDNLKEDKSGY